MKDTLIYFIKESERADNYSVNTLEQTKNHSGSSITYKIVLSTFFRLTDSNEQIIDQIDTGKLPLWSGKSLERILLQTNDSLNDFSKYRWSEIKAPILDYWLDLQKSSIESQKRTNPNTTVWTPGGDYTLWRLGEFISNILLRKYLVLKDDSILMDLDKKNENFEDEINKLILLPIKTYISIETIVNSDNSNVEKIKQIIDSLVSFSEYAAGSNERILDPNFNDDVPFLSTEEERKLNSLWVIYHDVKTSVESNQKLSKFEKFKKMQSFWHSPQGKDLNRLNARRSNGGTLSFEATEKKKQQRVNEISEILWDILSSWGFAYSELEGGLGYYQTLFEKESQKRWESHNKLEESLKKSESEINSTYDALQGIWNSDSLQLLGIILGIGIGVGFGFASLMTESIKVDLCIIVIYFSKLFIGLFTGISSIFVLVILLRTKVIRRQLIIFSNKVLK